MPTYVSNGGKWTPAQEKNVVVKDPKTGENTLYSGPCREAVKELAMAGVEHLGNDYKDDPEFLEMIRARKYESVEEYLRVKGITKEKEAAEFKKRNEETVAHKATPKKRNIITRGGGTDLSGQGNDVHGKIGNRPN